MGKSQKSKRVIWASDANLCQVRLFLSEESPSQIGTGTQDHLQALCPVKSSVMGSDDNLPPGFEGMQPANMWRVKLSQIPLINWRCPPRFKVDSEWRVVAGEESKEIEAQNQREMRVLEAIYPRQSAIPPNPSALAGVEDSTTNDQNTPLVPITPIEDDDDPIDTSLNSFTANSNPMIDPNLLIKILSDPKMVEQLVASPNIPSPNIPNMPSSTFQSIPAIGVQKVTQQNMPSASTPYMPNWRSPPKGSFDPLSAHVTRPDLIPSMGTTNGPFYPPPRSNNPDPPSTGAHMAKDINYYKSLIQQHGEERRDVLPQFAQQSNQPMGISQEPPKRESKPKIMKPCIYFNSSRGCRNGANCTFQHEMSPQQSVGNIMEAQSAKRVKLDRGITGT
ncbi:hypothetical protein BUALT_Bualt01G0026800 [Buddleja alternifolia]|uniref:C3H1-type domain-containing protein n=1 Tax=Buddleja alternifolia TaxID=168488 RepID=A0AAV6Y5B8_9LAMI|nr:hypothetical protein BUALT_Bualt01G0026800 [Buddleja alternifolia]